MAMQAAASAAAAANRPPSVDVVLVQDCVANGDLVLPGDVAQGLTGGMAAQLVHQRAAAAQPGHLLPPGVNRRDRGRQLSAFFPVLTPHTRPAEPPAATAPRRRHRFARMWCELTTTASSSFALSNFGAWLLKGGRGGRGVAPGGLRRSVQQFGSQPGWWLTPHHLISPPCLQSRHVQATWCCCAGLPPPAARSTCTCCHGRLWRAGRCVAVPLKG